MGVLGGRADAVVRRVCLVCRARYVSRRRARGVSRGEVASTAWRWTARRRADVAPVFSSMRAEVTSCARGYRCPKKTRTELRDKKLVALHGHERRLQRGPAQERQGYRREGHLRRRRVREVRPADHQ